MSVEEPPAEDDLALTETAADQSGPRHPPDGQIGRFEVVESLGAGGMGVVLLAEDRDLERRVAIKLVHRQSADASDRLVREARALARLSHPNVVVVHEVGVHEGQVFVAMEYIKGRDLRAWLGDDPPLDERRRVLLAAGRGLEAAHRAGLVHRDFKPANVMVGDDGRVRVVDFGLAVSAGVAIPEASDSESRPLPRMTATGVPVGTPQYMAPEQWTGGEADARSDQFAFAATAFEVLCGEPAFPQTGHAELEAAVSSGERSPWPDGDPTPAPLRAAIDRALAPDPAARHADIAPLLELLDAGEPRRRGVAWVAAAAIAAAAIAVATIALAPGGELAIEAPDLDALALASSDFVDLNAEPVDGDPFEATTHRLSNGLTLIVSPDPRAARITAILAVRGGWSREPPELPGVAELAVKVLAAGTDRIGSTDFEAERPALAAVAAAAESYRRSPGPETFAAVDRASVAASRLAIPDEIATTLEELSATDINAWVDLDALYIQADIPSHRLADWATLEAERWRAPVGRLFLDAVAKTAVEIDRAGAADRAFEALFPGHPHGTRGGVVETLSQLPLAETLAYLREVGVANNAAVVLVGDVNTETALPVLERALGGWRPGPVPPPPPPAPPANPGRARDRGPPGVVLAYRVGPPRSSRHAAAEALSALVASTAPEIPGFRGFVLEGRAGVLFEMSADVPPTRDHRAIERRLRGVLAPLAANTMDPQLLSQSAARPAQFASFMTEVRQTRAQALAQDFARGVSRSAAVAWQHERESITPESVKALGAELAAAPAVVSDMTPGEGSPLPGKPSRLEPAAGRSQFARVLLERAVASREPQFLRLGRDVSVAEGRGGPILRPIAGGSRSYLFVEIPVPERLTAEACAALAIVVEAARGAAADPPPAGLRLVNFCSRGRVALGLHNTMSKGADGVAWLRRVTAEPDKLLQASPDAAGAVLEVLRAPVVVASRAPLVAQLAATGRHSMQRIYSAQTVREVDVAAWIERLLCSRRTTVYVGPDVDGLDDLFYRPGCAPAPPARPLARPVRPGNRVALHETGTPGFDVALLWDFGPGGARARALCEIAAVILSNRARRARWRGGLAVAGGELTEWRDHNLLAIDLESWPDRLVADLDATLAALGEPVTGDEARLAIAGLDARYRDHRYAAFDRVETALRIARDGGGDPRQASYDALASITTGEVSAQIAGLARVPRTIAVVGDLSAIDRAALARFGGVEVVSLEQLTGPAR